ncbi:ubiquinone anaerobic biosynthesis accessory factor UbiT [Acidimangrovimonas pyrenivorans]|uniref:SCP2 domain-containing protein n=1 Tax=Acidimangrovimonas pyrenivorans TaxID=2030798 RepID=A0ABV7AEZ1_9RHOB
MTETHTILPPKRRLLPTGLICAALRPVLARVVQRVARRHPEMFARIAPYQTADFLIVPVELPFALHLRPDPEAPLLRAVPRDRLPVPDARIEGPFLLLLELVDGESDGDAAFFSRDLIISGNTEAVVSLRNALDDVDGSIAQETADLFGPPGRAILGMLRRRSGRQ